MDWDDIKAGFPSYSFLLPAVFVALLVSFMPLMYLIGLSFTDLSFTDPARTGAFVGVENYLKLASDDQFWNSVRITLILMFLAVPIQLVLGLAVALLLNQLQSASRVITSLLMIPMTIAPITTGLAWRFMLNNEFGLLPYLMRAVGILGPDPLLGTPGTALPTILAIQIWMWTPFMALIMLAGLRSLPVEPMEAALIDGAKPWQVLRDITIPLMKPVMLVAVLLRGIDIFQIFDEVFILTGGGPGDATDVLMIFSFREIFRFWEMGYGAAVALTMALISLAGTLIVYRFVRPNW